MANAVARAPDGSVFASNDLGTAIDRVLPTAASSRIGPCVVGQWSGRRSRGATPVRVADLHLCRDQARGDRTACQRDHAHTGAVWARAAAIDGLTIDGHDRLYIAAKGAGRSGVSTRMAQSAPLHADCASRAQSSPGRDPQASAPGTF